MDIRVGEHFLDESVVQAKDKVNEVNFRLEHLIEQIHHISKEQNYERVCMFPNGTDKNIVHRHWFIKCYEVYYLIALLFLTNS